MKVELKVSNIVSVGGDKSKSVSEVYSVSDVTLNAHPDLPCNLSDHCALKLDDLIYCLAELLMDITKKQTNKVYQLSLKAPNLGWEEVASMAEKRSSFSAAVYKGCLVVAGGCNEIHDHCRIVRTSLEQMEHDCVIE